MEHNKFFIVFLLLTIYTFTINKRLFMITFLFLISFVFYLNNKIKLCLTFLVVYLLTLIIYKKKKYNIEKFKSIKKNKIDNFKNQVSTITQESTDPESIDPESIDPEDTILLTNSVFRQSSDSQHSMTMKNYQETFFVLNSLLEKDYIEKNKENIEKILVEYKINDLFNLSINILNKEENNRYNNLLEKITCIDENGSPNYLQCNNNNYTKLKAFADLFLVYTLEIDKVVELINVYEIYALCDLSAKRYILKDGEIENYNHFGLLYYLNERSFNDKYYEILKILGLTEELSNNIMIRETLYNYNDKNKRLSKDLNSIMLLFNYFKVFDEILLNYDELEYNWELVILKSVDLNQSYWDTISYFKDYDIKEKIIRAINKFTKTEDDIFSIELAQKCIDKKEKEKKKDEEEYKVLPNEDSDKCNINKEFSILEEMTLDYILKNFSIKMIDIINDFVTLFNMRCTIDCPNNESKFGKYIFYIKEIAKILTKDERLFFVGLLFLVIGILMNFVNLSN